uniref:HAT C-terminal dimerisation domain-containing protein n=1 Tax=Latimeria chalumnae TaxID=7897 RepID=H3A385_LATCH
TMGKKISFDSWKYKHYFELKSMHGKNIMVICLCKPKVREYSTAKNSTLNLKKHLHNIHKTTKLVARLDTQQSLKRLCCDEDDCDDIPPATNKRCHYTCTEYAFKMQSSADAQKCFERNLLNFVIETIQPLVKQPSFKQLVEGPNRKVMSCKTLTNHIDATYRTMRTTIMAHLADITSVCTTADIWTAHNKSFFRMTCHWIDPTSLQQVSAALACTQTHGKHTFDITASLIDEAHTSFSLGDKVRTVTENGSNFAKAFKEYGFQEEEDEETAEVDHKFGLISDMIDQPFQLPKHQRCTTHTLNLIVAYDIHKHLSCTSGTSAVYRSSVAKCSALWNKASRSCKAYEVIEDNANRKLIVPCVTQWNSFYNAVERIMSIEHLSIMCDEMGVAKFKMHEINFLKEYCKVLKPFTMALDILQGEDKCYYGYLFLTLLKLMDHLQHSKIDLKVATSLPDTIISIHNTEGKPFQEAMVAAVTLPMFKIEEARKIGCEAGTTLLLQQQESTVVCIDSSCDNLTISSLDPRMWMLWLTSDISLACMSKYPNVREVFLKYNATILSSAPVERLFSLGARVFAPRHNRLSDKHFKIEVPLKKNTKILFLLE